MSGLLSQAAYDCPTCIQCDLYASRNCTGGPLVERDNGMALDPTAPLPGPLATWKRPAYPNGLADLAAEAASLGITELGEALRGNPDQYEPIQHCARLVFADEPVRGWLQLYASIANGFRTPPMDAPEWYDAIMLGIRSVVREYDEARARAANRTNPRRPDRDARVD